MKRLIPLFLAALCLLPTLPAWAITVLIQKSNPQAVPFLLVDSATGQTGQTGQASNITVTVEYPGTNTYVASAGTITEDGNGNYDYLPAASEVASTGRLLIHAVCSGCQTVDVSAQVVAFNPNDGSLLGLNGVGTLANQTAQATTLGTINTNTAGTNTAVTSTGVKVASTQSFNNAGQTTPLPANATQWGGVNVTGMPLPTGSYTAPTTPPTVPQIAAGILKTPANLLATDANGNVGANNFPATVSLVSADEAALAGMAATLTGTGANTQFTAKALSSAPTGTGGGSGLNDAQTQQAVQEAMFNAPGTFTPQSSSALQGTPGTGSIFAQEAANASAIAALPASIMGASLITIPGTHTSSGSPITLTGKQAQALALSIQAGDMAQTPLAPSGTATVTYYLPGAAHSSSTITDVATLTTNSSGAVVSRSDVVTAPFPSF